MVDPEKAASAEREMVLEGRVAWVENERLALDSDDGLIPLAKPSSVNTSPLASAAIGTLFSDNSRLANDGNRPGESLGLETNTTNRQNNMAIVMMRKNPSPPFRTLLASIKARTPKMHMMMMRSTVLASQPNVPRPISG